VTYTYTLTHFLGNDTYLWELDRSKRPVIETIETFFEEIDKRSASFDQWFPSQVLIRKFPHGGVFEAPAIQTLHTIGWSDNIAPWSFDDVREISASHPDWQLSQYLYIDSTDHENYWFEDSNRSAERSPQQIEELLPRLLDPTIEFFDVF